MISIYSGKPIYEGESPRWFFSPKNKNGTYYGRVFLRKTSNDDIQWLTQYGDVDLNVDSEITLWYSVDQWNRCVRHCTPGMTIEEFKDVLNLEYEKEQEWIQKEQLAAIEAI